MKTFLKFFFCLLLLFSNKLCSVEKIARRQEESILDSHQDFSKKQTIEKLPTINEDSLIGGFQNDLKKGRKLKRKETHIQKTDFDIEKFVDELNKYHCDKEDKNCERNLKKQALAPIGETGMNSTGFYNFLKSNIYQPLGYNMASSNNLSDLLVNLTQLPNKSTLFLGQPSNINYKTVEESLLESFQDIVGKTSDVDAYQEAISQLVISMLKKLHLYWNSLRDQNQMEKAKDDTKELIKNIAKVYFMKDNFLFQVAKTVMQKIKNAYYRFSKAHYMAKTLKENTSSVVADQMFNRFSMAMDEIKFTRFNYIQINQEIATEIQMFQAFIVLLYREGNNEPNTIIQYKLQIFQRYVEGFNAVKNMLTGNDPIRLKDIKEFTAVLLLKFEHFFFIMTKFHALTDYANMDNFQIGFQRNITVKVLQDLNNSLVLIPETCLYFLKLKVCVINETNKILKRISGKYSLKRSTRGWNLFNYIINVIRGIFTDANSMVWSNWNVFKMYYFQNLFAALYHFKKKFLINDDMALDNLEEMFGSTIDEFRKDNKNLNKNYSFLDIFDSAIYEKFLDIRGFFNKDVPYDKDPEVLTSIQNRLYEFLQNFSKKFGKEIDHDFVKLFKDLKNQILSWKTKEINALSIKTQVATLPVRAAELNPHLIHIFSHPPSTTDEINNIRRERKLSLNNININQSQNESLNRKFGLSGTVKKLQVKLESNNIKNDIKNI